MNGYQKPYWLVFSAETRKNTDLFENITRRLWKNHDDVIKPSILIMITRYLRYFPTPTAKEPIYNTWSWRPRYNFSIAGPLVGGSQISISFYKPDGAFWMSDLQEPSALSQEQMPHAIETGNCLLQVIRAAQAAGLSDKVQVELNAVQMTLLATETLGNYVATTGCELLKKRYRCGEEGRE